MQRYSALPVQTPKEPLTTVTEPNKEDSFSQDFQHHVGRWPQEPKTLRASTPSWVYRLAPHLALILVPIASICLGVVVLSLDGKAKSSNGDVIKQAMAVTATLWPILFAGVLGPMLKAVALYRAERGTKFGLLEILSSSHTLVSTLRGFFSLRMISLWSTILVLLWSLSPVGGQGALRALNIKQNITNYEFSVSSYPMNNLSIFSDSPFESASGQMSWMNQFRAPINAVFTAQDVGLLQRNDSKNTGFSDAVSRAGGTQEAVRITQRDLWRNVRIPLLHSLPNHVEGTTDWTAVPSDVIPEYSSLIGVPVRGIPSIEEGNATFVIQTNYQTLTCMPWVASPEWRRAHNGSFMPEINAALGTSGLGLPIIYLDMVIDPSRYSGKPVLAQSNVFGRPFDKLTLAFYTRNENLTLCDVGTEYVDSRVECSRATTNREIACTVREMRRSPDMKGMGNLTALDISRTYTVLKHIPYTMASLHPSQSSILEKWLQNPARAFVTNYNMNVLRYDSIPPPVFSNRLAMVLNTYLRATLNMTILVGSDGTSLDHIDGSWGNTTGTWAEFTEPIYYISKPWFALYFISAIVLTVCALANIILRYQIHVPDFLSSTSALTRDSLFFNVPTPASGMDGTERARLLRDKWVMIQDVQPDETVGRIAFSDAVANVGVRMDRRYV